MGAATTKYMSNRGSLLGDSPQMDAVRQMMEKAAQIDLPLLVMGETGTGKDLVARKIHALSDRADGPFVVISAGARSQEPDAKGLFGTAARLFSNDSGESSNPYFEADGGTLFLDEIGALDETSQINLMRVLEEGAFRSEGDANASVPNVRLIAATNIDLDDRVEQGLFREDLYHRLKVLCIKVPALREHVDDIPVLTDHFLGMLNREFDFSLQSVSSEAMDLLQYGYDWPGNVRELKNVIAQAAVLAEEGVIEPKHLPAHISGESALESGPADCNGSDLPGSNGARPWRTNGSTNHHRPDSADKGALDQRAAAANPGSDGLLIPVGHTFDHVLREYAMLTLVHCKGNKTKAAKMLNISRKTLHDRLNKWDLGTVTRKSA